MHSLPIDFLEKIERALSERRWDIASELARTYGTQAIAEGDSNAAIAAGDVLERLNQHTESAYFLAAGGRLKKPSALPEWDGSRLDGTLLVIQRIRHIGAAIRLARLIPIAERLVKRCIILAEPRLVPLFARSFPNADVRADASENNDVYLQADVVASYETLTAHLVGNDPAGTFSDTFLKADSDSAARFRDKYHSSPLIGFAWHSTNKRKEMPSIEAWSALIRSVPATFVSLQYGEVANDIDEMRALSGKKIVFDTDVDPLSNIDLAAAQIAALDLVVTISSTAAHLAGALGVPLYVLLDDKNHLVWPLIGRTTAWYPTATLIRKNGRRWSQVFEELSGMVET